MDQVYINKAAICQVLDGLKTGILKIDAFEGPYFDRYEVYPKPGQSVSEIKRHAQRLEKALQSKGFRMYFEGYSVVIELWHGKMCGANQRVDLQPLIDDPHYDFPLPIGHEQQGKPLILDPAGMSSAIMTAGQGSQSMLDNLCSICLMKAGTMVAQIASEAGALAPAHFDDPYHGCECVDESGAVPAMRAICQEIERRSKVLQDTGCRDLWELRRINPERSLGYVAVFVYGADKLLKNKKNGLELKRLLLTIASCGPKAGILTFAGWEHGTIDPLVKFNFPCRIVSRTSTSKESRDYLDTEGGEKLVEGGYDALLYDSTRGELTRFTSFSA